MEYTSGEGGDYLRVARLQGHCSVWFSIQRKINTENNSGYCYWKGEHQKVARWSLILLVSLIVLQLRKKSTCLKTNNNQTSMVSRVTSQFWPGSLLRPLTSGLWHFLATFSTNTFVFLSPQNQYVPNFYQVRLNQWFHQFLFHSTWILFAISVVLRRRLMGKQRAKKTRSSNKRSNPHR